MLKSKKRNRNLEPFDMGEKREVVYPKSEPVKKKKRRRDHEDDGDDDERRKKKKKLDKDRPYAILEHKLFVEKRFVTQKMLDDYTSVIEDYFPEEDEYGEPIEDRNLYVQGYKYIKKHKVYAFQRGDVAQMAKTFKGFKIEDNTSAPELRLPVQFLGVPVKGEMLPLRPDQKKAIKQVFAEGYGILEAPPRFGKTTVMTKLVTKYGLRTIMFVHQIDLARQFEAEFRSCTDVNALERKHGRKIIGIARNWDDVAKLDVAIVTWQKFHAGKGGKKALKRFRNRFGLMLIDEGHRFSSQFSSKVISSFNTRYRIGVTATPERKDKRDVIFKQIVGNVVAKGRTKQVPMRVHPVYTGFYLERFGRWNTLVSRLCESANRNKICINTVVDEVKAGHHVLIVTTRKKHIMDLCDRLKAKGIRAEAFYGGVKGRDDILRRAKSGQTKVIVGMRSMLTGVNVPRWDRMHILIPTSNKPNHYQEFSRVRTISENKPFCIVHHYIDNIGASRACYRTCHSNYTNEEYKPIVFIDDNGNVIKTPSLKTINQRSEEAVLKGTRRGSEGVGSSGNAASRINAVLGWGGELEDPDDKSVKVNKRKTSDSNSGRSGKPARPDRQKQSFISRKLQAKVRY